MLSVTIVIFKTLPFKVYALLRVYIVVSNDFAPYRATSYRVLRTTYTISIGYLK